MVERYGITEHDRFSQTFDLTFDLSVFDMFVAWERGACVCCPPETRADDARRGSSATRELTIWFSVPSTAVVHAQARRCSSPTRYPTLRWSLFCGEPLPVEVAAAWAAAAPSSTRREPLRADRADDRLHAATAGTGERSPAEAEHGVVPIGEPLPGHAGARRRRRRCARSRRARPASCCMTGPQVTLGYWRDPERTAAAFVVPPGRRRDLLPHRRPRRAGRSTAAR